jgi:hypothetical protein
VLVAEVFVAEAELHVACLESGRVKYALSPKDQMSGTRFCSPAAVALVEGLGSGLAGQHLRLRARGLAGKSGADSRGLPTVATSSEDGNAQVCLFADRRSEPGCRGRCASVSPVAAQEPTGFGGGEAHTAYDYGPHSSWRSYSARDALTQAGVGFFAVFRTRPQTLAFTSTAKGGQGARTAFVSSRARLRSFRRVLPARFRLARRVFSTSEAQEGMGLMGA